MTNFSFVLAIIQISPTCIWDSVLLFLGRGGDETYKNHTGNYKMFSCVHFIFLYEKRENLPKYLFLSILIQRCTCLSHLKCHGISMQTAIPGSGNLKKYYCQILMQFSNKTISHEMKGIIRFLLHLHCTQLTDATKFWEKSACS